MTHKLLGGYRHETYLGRDRIEMTCSCGAAVHAWRAPEAPVAFRLHQRNPVPQYTADEVGRWFAEGRIE